jgi:hypothetical protein
LSKQKDAATTHKKEKSWNSIFEAFNSNENVTRRDIEQRKSCLVDIQTKAKKEDAQQKASMRKTGGGCVSPVPIFCCT